MRRVEPFALWVGHVGDARDLKGLLAQEVAALVDLAANELPAHVTRELIYCRFPLVDGAGNAPGLLKVAVATLTGLIRERTPTLVYCSAGMSRTPAVVAVALAAATDGSPAHWLTHLAKFGAADVSPALWEDVCRAGGFGPDPTL